MPSGETVAESVNSQVRDHAEKKAREGDERYVDYGGPIAAKLRNELAAARKELDQHRATMARYDAAEKAGIPIAHADRLKGDTVEALAADAAEFAKSLALPKNQNRPSAAPRRPVPKVGGGIDAHPDVSISPIALASAIVQRFRGES